VSVELAIAALVTLVAVFAALRASVGFTAALAIAFVKTALPLGYFAFAFQPQWTFLDDLYYLHQGEVLLRHGFHPFASLLDPRMWAELVGMASGLHILYGWWNFLAQWLFGTHYWSAVFLNVIVSAIAARCLHALLIQADWSRRHATAAAIFFALHWELLAWCSVSNLKDILVLALLLYQCKAMMQLARTREGRLRAFVVLSVCVVLLCFVRFYLPILAFIAFFGWLLLSRQDVSRLRLALLASIVAAAVMGFVVARLRGTGAAIDVGGAVVGLLRVIVTPQPWSVDEAFGFMLLPSALHWLFLALLPFGVYGLWRDNGVGRFVLILLAILTCFYAMVPDLQGPRSRVQMLPLIATVQFRGLLLLVWLALAKSDGAREARGFVKPAPRGPVAPEIASP
jgi:hypothetical protein